MQVAGLVLIANQDALSRAMDVVANNIANVSTTGFKRQEILFDTYVSRPAPDEKIQFGIDSGTFRDAAQGPMQATGNPFDLAIQGAGYFPIQTKAGTRYTRGGSFQLNSDGDIVTASGDKLMGDGDQSINIPIDALDVNISSDGVITAMQGASKLELGKLKFVTFKNEQNMHLEGTGLYSTTEQPTPDTESQVVQGMLEQSNVEAVTEITRMIAIQRYFEMSAHLLDLDNQRQLNAISRLSKTTA